MGIASPYNRPGRIRNWPALNQAYVDRGRIEMWVDPAMFQAPKKVKGKNGRPQEYTDGLIQMLLLLKIKFNLSYRGLEGHALSILALMPSAAGDRKAVPSFGTIAERVRHLGRSKDALVGSIKKLAMEASGGKPKGLLVDSTGVSRVGMGPWRATRPWTTVTDRKKRRFVKLHIGFNPITGMIEAAIVTPSNTHDSIVVPSIIEEAGVDSVVTVAADGAYHTHAVFDYLIQRGIRDIRIPPPKNAVEWKNTLGAEIHNKAVSECYFSRKDYKKKSGYHVRSLVESTMSGLQRLTGSRAKSKSDAGVSAEVLAACIVLNKEASLARADYNQRAWTSAWLPQPIPDPLPKPRYRRVNRHLFV